MMWFEYFMTVAVSALLTQCNAGFSTVEKITDESASQITTS